MNLQQYLSISRDVQQALRLKKPVVALETASILCGLPLPHRFSSLQKIHDTILKAGATPAFIVIYEGTIQIGLSHEMLFSISQLTNLSRITPQDLPFALISHRTGAVTSATGMIAATLGGINVLSTPCLGGIVQEYFDISADLYQLQNCSLAVVSTAVSHGVNLRATKKHLETIGIPLLGLSALSQMQDTSQPAPNLFMPCEIITHEQAAKTAKIKWSLGLCGGILFTCGCTENTIYTQPEYENVLMRAKKQAACQQLQGKDFPAFLSQFMATHYPQVMQAKVEQSIQCAQHASSIASLLCRLR